MTVKELIDELLATCRNDGEQVVVQDSGLVTRVSTGKLPRTGEPAVFLNDYPPSEDAAYDGGPEYEDGPEFKGWEDRLPPREDKA